MKLVNTAFFLSFLVQERIKSNNDELFYELTSTSIDGSLTGYLSDVGDADTTELIYMTGDGKVHESLPKGTYYIRVYKDSIYIQSFCYPLCII